MLPFFLYMYNLNRHLTWHQLFPPRRMCGGFMLCQHLRHQSSLFSALYKQKGCWRPTLPTASSGLLWVRGNPPLRHNAILVDSMTRIKGPFICQVTETTNYFKCSSQFSSTSLSGQGRWVARENYSRTFINVWGPQYKQLRTSMPMCFGLIVQFSHPLTFCTVFR